MRNKVVILILMLGVLLYCEGLAQADDITFTSSGAIDSPQVWDLVEVKNNGTMVNMLGGQVTKLYTYNASIFNMSGGQISSSPSATIVIDGPSTFNISGGGDQCWLFYVVWDC